MKSERLVHGTKDLCKLLDQRIDKLQEFRVMLLERIGGNVAVKKNSKELVRVMASLVHAKTARRALEDSCCEYSCTFEPHDR